MDERIYVGVLRLVVAIPGARSLKDRRQAVRSLMDRVRHRFSVTANEVGTLERPGQQTLVFTTAGNDSARIRGILDEVARSAAEHARLMPVSVDVDVFRWHPQAVADGFFVEEDTDG